ncbi:MAG: PH domain-containing protein [Planctomycetota bacterium]|jgi:hypothetical protein
MSPPSESANATPAKTLVPGDVLRDDEVMLLAIKPSGWFVVLVSWPVLILAALIAAATQIAGTVFGAGVPWPELCLLCLAAGLLRLVVASFQWLGRVYVLTDKRLMRIRGVLRVDVYQCPLRQVTRTALEATRGERLLGLASLFFEADDLDAREAAWTNLARPEEVRRVVDEAIRRARFSARRKP